VDVTVGPAAPVVLPVAAAEPVVLAASVDAPLAGRPLCAGVPLSGLTLLLGVLLTVGAVAVPEGSPVSGAVGTLDGSLVGLPV
jgi:hypothetical protein